MVEMQALHDLSGRDAVAAMRCDIRWKVAYGPPLDHEGFHPTTLTYWRRRLAASDCPALRRGLGEGEIVDLDGNGEVVPLAGGEGERGAVWVLGVADGDVVLADGPFQHSDLDAAS